MFVIGEIPNPVLEHSSVGESSNNCAQAALIHVWSACICTGKRNSAGATLTAQPEQRLRMLTTPSIYMRPSICRHAVFTLTQRVDGLPFDWFRKAVVHRTHAPHSQMRSGIPAVRIARSEPNLTSFRRDTISGAPQKPVNCNSCILLTKFSLKVEKIKQ
jgi:hypothetical protein